MRNLNECQAEVFRRSEKRIKERKQRRNHILMACIPLVLCITLFSAFLLPGVLPEDAKDAGPAGEVNEDKSESLACAYTKIDVTGNGISLSYTEASDVLNISNQLTSYMVNEPESNLTGSEEIRGEDFQDGTEDDLHFGMTGATSAAGAGYVITLTLHEGGTIAYRLSGNSLLDMAENKTYKLTQAQLKELNELLGIK